MIPGLPSPYQLHKAIWGSVEPKFHTMITELGDDGLKFSGYRILMSRNLGSRVQLSIL